jgi:sugar lactone lactonase YvrE
LFRREPNQRSIAVFRNSPRTKTLRICALAATQFAVAAGCSSFSIAADRSEIAVEGGVFPESITSSDDGSIFFGSLSKGAVYRAAPGAVRADIWIKPGSNGLRSITGVFADGHSNTLWTCSSPIALNGGAAPPGETSLKAFDLKTAAFKASYTFPGGTGLCNDIAVARDGTVYATETGRGWVVRLKPGASALEVWSSDSLLASADGIAVLADGAVYVNGFGSGIIARVPVRPDGSAGPAVKIATSERLVNPDGMRSVGNYTLLVAEGKGRADEITINGDRGEVRVLKTGLDGPTAVTRVGNFVFILEAKLRYLNDPKLRGQDPGPIHAWSVAYAGK